MGCCPRASGQSWLRGFVFVDLEGIADPCTCWGSYGNCKRSNAGNSICVLRIVVFDILLLVPHLAGGEQIVNLSEHRVMIFDILVDVPSLLAGERIVMLSEHPSLTVSIDLATGEFTNPLTEPKSTVATGESGILPNKTKATTATGRFMVVVTAQSEVSSNVTNKTCALIGAYVNCGFIALGGDERFH